VAGAVIWLDALLVRLLFRADQGDVWFLGRKIAWVCSLRARLGLPCPTCGLTRGMVLTLHGDVAGAWLVSPAAPVFAFGLLAIGTGLLLLPWLPGLRTRFRRAALIFAAAAIVFWITSWAFRFASLLRA
jgi:hypothetical protein